jgi:hypothetical protein
MLEELNNLRGKPLKPQPESVDGPTQRICETYTLLEQRKIKAKHKILLAEIESMTLEEEACTIHPNQLSTGLAVMSNFKNTELIHQMVIAPPQSGKTGCMFAIIYQALIDPNFFIPIENMYILSGFNNTDWKTQTAQRMPPSLHKQIINCKKLQSELPKLLGQTKKNILILIDEVHMACKSNQSMFKSFQACSLIDKQELLRRDVKIVELSATPDGVLTDLRDWQIDFTVHSKILFMAPSPSYVSSYDLLLSHRIKQFIGLNHGSSETSSTEDMLKHFHTFIDESTKLALFKLFDDCRLCLARNVLKDGSRATETKFVNDCVVMLSNLGLEQEDNLITQFKYLVTILFKSRHKIYTALNCVRKDINELGQEHGFLYHIFRVPTACDGFARIKESMTYMYGNEYDYVNYFQNDKEDINTLLSVKPKRHTIIFVKEKLRAAKTLIKTYLGVCYDRCPENPDDSVVLQSLVSRMLGYDTNNFSICYTNIETVQRYQENTENEWSEKAIKLNWHCKNKNDTAYNLKEYVATDDDTSSETSSTSGSSNTVVMPAPIIKVKTFLEIINHWKTHLKDRGFGGPNMRGRKQTEDGFWQVRADHKFSGSKVFSVSDFEEIEKTGLWKMTQQRNSKRLEHRYRVYPCYRDLNDNSTLEWWYIYYL